MSSTQEKHVSNLQESIAVALANTEIQRLRIKRLELENVHLRNVLRKHGIAPIEDVDLAEELRKSDSITRHTDASGQSAQPDDAEPEQEEEEWTDYVSDVQLFTDGVSAPGRIVVSKDSLEFLAVASQVTAASFLGIRVCGSQGPAKSEQGLSRGSWFDTFFGPGGKRRPSFSNDAPLYSRNPASNPITVSTGAWQSKPVSGSAPAAARPPDPDTRKAPSFGMQDGVSSWAGYVAGLTPRSWQSKPNTPPSAGLPPPAPGGGPSGLCDIAFEADAVSVAAPQQPEGMWQLSWKEKGGGGHVRSITFVADEDTRQAIHEALSRFSVQSDKPFAEAGGGLQPLPPTNQDSRPVTRIGEANLVSPHHLEPDGALKPLGSAVSTVISADEASAVAAALPGRRRISAWRKVYCTETDGFSLQSLYRAGSGCARSVLLVEDFGGYVFGAFCTDPLKVAPRYQGTGECFAFQLRPHRIRYGWHKPKGSDARNDFFMLVSFDSLGIGGAPHFAIWLDSDLLHGNSGMCQTFASPTLSRSEDFRVKKLELWQVE